MTRYAWLTDIHLEFLGSKETIAFVKELPSQKLDGLFPLLGIDLFARL